MAKIQNLDLCVLAIDEQGKNILTENQTTYLRDNMSYDEASSTMRLHEFIAYCREPMRDLPRNVVVPTFWFHATIGNPTPVSTIIAAVNICMLHANAPTFHLLTETGKLCHYPMHPPVPQPNMRFEPVAQPPVAHDPRVTQLETQLNHLSQQVNVLSLRVNEFAQFGAPARYGIPDNPFGYKNQYYGTFSQPHPQQPASGMRHRPYARNHPILHIVRGSIEHPLLIEETLRMGCPVFKTFHTCEVTNGAVESLNHYLSIAISTPVVSPKPVTLIAIALDTLTASDANSVIGSLCSRSPAVYDDNNIRFIPVQAGMNEYYSVSPQEIVATLSRKASNAKPETNKETTRTEVHLVRNHEVSADLPYLTVPLSRLGDYVQKKLTTPTRFIVNGDDLASNARDYKESLFPLADKLASGDVEFVLSYPDDVIQKKLVKSANEFLTTLFHLPEEKVDE